MKPVVISNDVLDVLRRLPLTFALSDLATGEIVWASSPTPETFGVPSAERIVGRCLLEFIDSDQQLIALRDLQAVAAGESPPPVIYHLKRVGGGIVDIQIASMPTMLDGKPGMLSVLSDVSESERSRRELEEATTRYQLFVNRLPDGVVVVGAHGIVYTNETFVRAIGAESAEALVDEPLSRFIHPDSQAAMRESRRQAMRYEKEVPPVAVTLLAADGRTIDTSARTMFIHWQGAPASQTLFRDLAE